MNVVITGASSGIGKALAVTFASHGHSVLVVARREDRLRVLCHDLKQQSGASIDYLPLDITSPDAPQILFDHATKRFGKVHVLINNAGMSPYQEFHELNHAHLNQIIALNIRSLTELCELFLPHMQAHGESCRVVNVSSVGGFTPLPNFSVYCGSKHYVQVFSNMLNYEYRKTRIKIGAIYPGGTLTEFPTLAGQRLKKAAMSFMMTPEQVAEIAYPAIIRGRRVIIPGGLNQLAVLLGKLLPFPLAMRMTEWIYGRNVEQIPPTYPL